MREFQLARPQARSETDVYCFYKMRGLQFSITPPELLQVRDHQERNCCVQINLSARRMVCYPSFRHRLSSGCVPQRDLGSLWLVASRCHVFKALRQRVTSSSRSNCSSVLTVWVLETGSTRTSSVGVAVDSSCKVNRYGIRHDLCGHPTAGWPLVLNDCCCSFLTAYCSV
jgi:hypothetical protein